MGCSPKLLFFPHNSFLEARMFVRASLLKDHSFKETLMCRNIKTLYNFEPPVTEDEIHAAALQFVRKISGFNKPSKANEAAFQTAVDEIAAAASKLLHSLETNAPPKNREEVAAKARIRSARRFAQTPPHS